MLVRNGDALAMRPGLLGVWNKAGRAFDGESYLNRIGVSARLEDLTSSLAQPQMAVSRWYGVQVFTDTVASDEPVALRPGRRGAVSADVHARGEAVEQCLEPAFELAGQRGFCHRGAGRF